MYIALYYIIVFVNVQSYDFVVFYTAIVNGTLLEEELMSSCYVILTPERPERSSLFLILLVTSILIEPVQKATSRRLASNFSPT